MLGHALAYLVEAPRSGVEAHAGVAVALDEALNDEEEIDPDGLRAGVAAPGPPNCRRHEEKPEARHHQEPRDEEELLRPNLYEEEIEAPGSEVDKDCLIRRMRPAVPADPRRQIVDAERHQYHQPFEPAETTLGPLREDLPTLLVKRTSHAGGIDGFGIEPSDCSFGFGLVEHGGRFRR